MPASLTDTALDDLAASLTERLAGIAGPALLELFGPSVESGQASDTRYWAFVERVVEADGAALDREFPVLGPLLDLMVEQWVAAVRELLMRLGSDLDLLAQELGVVPSDVVQSRGGWLFAEGVVWSCVVVAFEVGG